MEILYGYLYTLKQFLIENQTDKTTDIINSIDNIIKNTNFSVLYDEKKRIFSIGYNVEENKLTVQLYIQFFLLLDRKSVV